MSKAVTQKDVNPGIWEAFFGGHVNPDEEYVENAEKEIKEEIGIEILKTDLIPYKVLKSDKPNHKEFQHVFALKVDETHFEFEKEEIDKVEWKTIQELRKILVIEKDPRWIIKGWDEEVLNWLTSL